MQVLDDQQAWTFRLEDVERVGKQRQPLPLPVIDRARQFPLRLAGEVVERPQRVGDRQVLAGAAQQDHALHWPIDAHPIDAHTVHKSLDQRRLAGARLA